MAGYGGRIIDSSQGIKQFFYFDPNAGPQVSTWFYTVIGGDSVLTPTNKRSNVLIKNNLIVEGSIIVPSDERIKDDVSEITKDKSENILELKPVQFIYKSDATRQMHFGFLAQEVEVLFPELVSDISPDYKAVNYIELIPLMVAKMKKMQEEIDELKQLHQAK
jgi:hypothetical protein